MVRNEELYHKMYRIQKGYQWFTRKMFLKRIFVGIGLKSVINVRASLRGAIYLVDFMGKEREDYFISFARGFKASEDYLARYRFKPNAALLSVLYDRVSDFDAHHFQIQCKKY